MRKHESVTSLTGGPGFAHSKGFNWLKVFGEV
jgi:hypothetical protein